MTVNLNSSPYFDDYNQDKNYHKVIFNPGKSVQSRELTQCQSDLQTQIGELSKFILSEGSKVSGANISFDYNIKIIKVTFSENDIVELSDLTNFYIVGDQSKSVAKIVQVYNEFSELGVKLLNISSTNTFLPGENLFVYDSKYTALNSLNTQYFTPIVTLIVDLNVSSNITINSGEQYSSELKFNSTAGLEIGDVLTHNSLLNVYSVTSIANSTIVYLDQKLEKNLSNVSITLTKPSVKNSFEVSVSDGVFFVKNTFVKCTPQSIIASRKTRYPSIVVGLKPTDTIIDFVDDSSLLDPSISSSNYSAPGADRYKLDLELTTKPLANNNIQDLVSSEKFIELVRIKNGEIGKVLKDPKIGELQTILSRQLFDHAGHFIIDPFKINISKSEFLNANSNTFSIQISPGKAYIKGSEFTTYYPSVLTCQKPSVIKSVANSELDFYYGSYVVTDSFKGLLNPDSLPQVELHSLYNCNSSTKIATARIQNYQCVGNNTFLLYLQDIKILKNLNIKDLKRIVVPTSNTYSSFQFSANVIQSSSNFNPILETNYPSLIFKPLHETIDLDQEIYFVQQKYNSVTANANSFFITCDSGENFVGGVGNLPLNEIARNFICVAKSTNGSYITGDIIPPTKLSVNINSTANRANLNVINSSYSGLVDIVYSVLYTVPQQPRIKILNSKVSTLNLIPNTSNSLQISDVYKINDVYKISVLENYIGDWNSATNYQPNNVISILNDGETEIHKCLLNNKNKSPLTLDTIYWEKQQPIENSLYRLDNGQRDFLYDHASIFSDKISGNVIVSFDYFEHTEGKFLSKRSYISANNWSNAPFIYKDSSYNIYDLKNCFDFRPKKENYSGTIIANNIKAAIPKTTQKLLAFPTANTEFISADTNTNSKIISSYNYRLQRIDKIVLADNLTFKIIQGEESETPVPPKVPDSFLTLATIFYNSESFDTNDFKIFYDTHRRYTMDDIGQLDKRIQRIEYYNALNLAEIGTLNNSQSDLLLSQRVKAGIFVDDFSSYDNCEVQDPEFLCQMTLGEKCCQPVKKYDYKVLQNQTDWHEIEYVLPHSTQQLTVPYYPFDETFDPLNDKPESFFISNLSPTGTHTLTPFDHIDFNGVMRLYPPKDDWAENFGELLVTANELELSRVNLSSLENIKYLPEIIKNNLLNQTLISQKNPDTKTSIEAAIQGYTRPIRVLVTCSNLCPFTKMYAFVNDLMMNGYCTPTKNPIGFIPSIDIVSSGVGYASNTVIHIKGANTTPAKIEPIIKNGKLIGADIYDSGTGYDLSNTFIEIEGVGTGANVKINVALQKGNLLYTDLKGELSYYLDIPLNDSIKFHQGDLKFSVSSRPVYPEFGHSTAKAIFKSSGYGGVTLSPITEIISTIKRKYKFSLKDYVLYPPTFRILSPKSRISDPYHTIENVKITKSGLVSFVRKNTSHFASSEDDDRNLSDYFLVEAANSGYWFVSTCDYKNKSAELNSSATKEYYRYNFDKDTYPDESSLTDKRTGERVPRTEMISTLMDFENWSKGKRNIMFDCSFKVFANYDNLDYYFKCEEYQIETDANNVITNTNIVVVNNIKDNPESFVEACNYAIELSKTNPFFNFTDFKKGIIPFGESFLNSQNFKYDVEKISQINKKASEFYDDLERKTQFIYNFSPYLHFQQFKQDYFSSISNLSYFEIDSLYNYYVEFIKNNVDYNQIFVDQGTISPAAKVSIKLLLDIKNLIKEIKSS